MEAGVLNVVLTVVLCAALVVAIWQDRLIAEQRRLLDAQQQQLDLANGAMTAAIGCITGLDTRHTHDTDAPHDAIH